MTLKPRWSLNISEWTLSEALCFPVPMTFSTQAPTGLRLIDLVSWDSVSQTVSLLDPSSITEDDFGAPVRVQKALTALQDGESSVPDSVLQLALSSSAVSPHRSSRRALHAHIQIAGVMLASFTVAVARHFLDRMKGVSDPINWQDRGVSRIGLPPSDIWKRLQHRSRTPRHKETFYKFLFNALPLGARISQFARKPGDVYCHYCPTQRQSMRHFLFSCPLAQAVWRELRLAFRLPSAVSLSHAAFSWSPNARVLGKRFGFKLQAGHAVAMHTLWLAHTAARYDNHPAA